MNINIIKIIKIEEESNIFKTKPYYCSEKYPTIGWGFKCGEKNQPLPNITMTPEEGEVKLNNYLGNLENSFLTNEHTKLYFSELDAVRQAVLMSMAYQIGFSGLLKFVNTLAHVSNKDWEKAANGIRNSLAYKQTTSRWERNAKMMASGILDPYYK